MLKNANSIDAFRMKAVSMHTLRLMWMVFSGFSSWFACAPLVSTMQSEFHSGATQQILPLLGVLFVASAICTATVRLIPQCSNRMQHRLPHSNITA